MNYTQYGAFDLTTGTVLAIADNREPDLARLRMIIQERESVVVFGMSPAMTGDDLKSRREALRMTQSTAATILGIGKSTVEKYEAGAEIPARSAVHIDQTFRQLEEAVDWPEKEGPQKSGFDDIGGRLAIIQGIDGWSPVERGRFRALTSDPGAIPARAAFDLIQKERGEK